ncbi:gluconate 2-dehydrogenase subunit 3 family protein [Salinisphaera sp. Q1T1-3]|uniref:gluconate 2-dehydrogenase subunit 3 family protein n=1 Tax=Salinisphaera sp. Q1T1-3 TaxID=2321229 RepID=UPI000E764BBE|nr:gluconate 2-dehydrogenase subunit 3 family protein [Salinisphaera sp. Q1T1-3]RJS94845.1 gluconate 2-dehydrogenase subunit 3 family protein [Salinisphaera sp. Q1T1-3]
MSFPIKPDPGRRRFVGHSLLALTAVGLGSTGALAARLDTRPPALDRYQPVFFKADEWRFIKAAVDRLIPADDTGPGALEANVPVFLDLQLASDYGEAASWYMQGPFVPDAPSVFGYQLPYTPAELYRAAIAAIDAHCRKAHGDAFAALTTADQEHVLSSLENGDIQLPDTDRGPLPARSFFGFLLKNTKEGFLADPIYGGNKHMVGWKMLGFTGARASFREWVDQYDRPYPLGPVSLSGEISR